ncbi:hypothetical protein K431DRAFT_123914 [Polychaeton citri CBS 116435]|uniref:XPG N-terminal domain-containing protein n=1 Tax=Polychaeton citri CBS 116435 TaxID=1314669 RepID=A0A9P4Q1K7_9PEZI|nr:hypothetical protein K431DRAFT_123914 [Polychaeton citri CBS 116435]
MGSVAFKEWAASEGHIKSSPLEQLKGSRVAIDAEDFLNALLSTSPTREPLLPALGGLPFALEHHVDHHLQSFQSADITPIFVFNGLDLACRDRRTISRESIKASRSLEEAWSLYTQTRAQEAVEEFGKTCKSKYRQGAPYILQLTRLY